MRVVPWTDLLAGRQKIEQPVRLTIGVFDGLHVGHRELMKAIVQDRGGSAAVVATFRRNPVQILAPSRFPGLILSYPQKLSRLSELGIDVVVAIDFSSEMSNLSGKAFIGLLRESLNIEKIVVGENFRFGRAREAGSGDLKQILFNTGVEVQVSQPVLRGDTIVSSSRIRKTIQKADFAEARAMLLAEYSLDLSSASGRCLEGGITRYERAAIEQVVPRPGRYQVSCQAGDGEHAAELIVRKNSIDLAAGPHERVVAIVFR